MKLLVIFYSKHGYVKRYVDIIGNALGCDAVPVEKFKGEMLSGYDKVLYIGSVRNFAVNGIKKVADFYDVVYKRLVVCGVGLTPFRDDTPDLVKDATVSVAYEKFIPVFYAQGGFDLEELSRTEKFSMALRVRQIRSSSFINEEDTCILNAVSQPIDEVKKENIQPLLDYLEGKPVDEKLYSPPEITDPEEEKKFFEELESAGKEKSAKRREVKRKLMK